VGRWPDVAPDKALALIEEPERKALAAAFVTRQMSQRVTA
jgi:hypothetical protein